MQLMAIVNFAIPKTLERRVGEVMKKKGFSTKAEFFRVAAMQFIDRVEHAPINEDARAATLTRLLEKEIILRYRGKKIPSVRQQLAQ